MYGERLLRGGNTMKKISMTFWREQAKTIEEQLDLKLVGDVASIYTKVVFTKVSAEGRRKILVTLSIPEDDRVNKPTKKYVSPFGETSSGVQ